MVRFHLVLIMLIMISTFGKEILSLVFASVGVKLRSSNLAGATGCIHRVHPNKSPSKILEKREHGRIQGQPKVFKYPLLSQEWVKPWTSHGLQIWPEHS